MKHSILSTTAWVSALLSMLLCLDARAEILLTAKYNGHTYHLLSAASWTVSQAEAAALGGSLATINDAAENAFVMNTFAPTASGGGGKVTLWIGLNDLQKEGTFTWASGETNSYTNFSGGQPQGSASDEDFVGIFANFGDVGRWHDVVSDNRLGDVTYGVVEVGTPGLWAAGRDLAANEKPDRPSEANAVNETVPAWSYGYRPIATGTDLTLYSADQHVNNDGGRTFDGFHSGDSVILANTGSQPVVYSLGFGNLKPLLPAQIVTHPSTSKMTVARWTAPAAGRYNIAARWLDLDNHGGNGFSCYVVIKGVAVFSQDVANDGVIDSPLQTVDLLTGETVDFVVGPRGGDHTFDSTGFNAAISVAPAVEMSVPGATNGVVTTSKGEVLGATNGTVTVTEGQDLVVTANILFTNPATSVELRDNGKVVGRDNTAPYQFTIENIESGTHYLTVVAVDQRGVEGVSNAVTVTVTKSASTAHAGTSSFKGADSSKNAAAAATEGASYFFNKSSGNWSDPNNWLRFPGGSGVPGPNDDAFIVTDGGANVTLNGNIEVKSLSVGSQSRIAAEPGTPNFEVSIVATNSIWLNDAELVGFSLFIAQGAEFQSQFDSRLTRMFIVNNGQSTFTGPGKTLGDATTELQNNGTVKVPRPVATNKTNEVVIPLVKHNGGDMSVEGAKLICGDCAFSAPVKLGASIITQDGASIITQDGASIITQDGASLIGKDGRRLIGPDGGSIISQDGASIISQDGASIAGNSGGTIIPRPGAGYDQANAQPNATSAEGIVLGPGAVITGRGNLIGNVINQAGFIAPGSSADVIRILGNYTQGSNGTLVLEVAGTVANPPQFDQLQITGSATLGGNLIVKTIDGFTPQSGDTFSALTYNSVSGSFANVTSNAQVSFGPNGMTMQVSGPNPPAPKALNIATRMKVETGDNVLIAGFIITGSQPKKVIIRGIGPSLPFGGILADPTLNLDNGAVTNDNWRTSQEQEIIATTIPPSNDLESAIVATLDPGPHTAVLRGSGNATGIGVVEVYDLESGSPVQLANISSRGLVQAGDDVMIGGFIIGGDYPAKMVVRAIGPSLPLPGKLEDPTLELVNQNGGRISNDNWRETQEAEIIATTIPPTNDNEAAIVATLLPGQYTAIVRGVDDTTGIAVVEAYNLQ